LQIIEAINAMRAWSEAERRAGRRIAFVPTMGFLHEGHLALVRDARARAKRVVVSIFVNPIQFAPSEDYSSYPRDFERDRQRLECEAVDVLFHPAAAAMYPPDAQTRVAVEQLSQPLCGALRPEHFSGVATVVTKLFNIVLPHVAIFGQKDYQQLQVVRRLVRDLSLSVEIVGHPTVREADGLAMSSRNAYLTSVERLAAAIVPRALCQAERLFRRGERAAQPIVQRALAELQQEPLATVEYVQLCDLETLQPIERVAAGALLAVAVRIGKARLIDNRVLGST
jgi:pantoate--beta-alanine ligase